MHMEGYSNCSEIESDQVANLQKLLSEIIPANYFYTQKLEAAGVDVNIESLEAFFQTFPFTSKAELIEDQMAHPPYGTTLTYPVENYTRFTLTSGTTGLPIRWLDTPESWAWMVENKAKVYQAAGVTSDDRGFFPFSFGPFLGFWVAFEAALFLKCLCFPGGGLSSLARLQMILDQEITFLCCTPTYAIRLGEVARAETMDLASSKVRAIFVGGEPGGSTLAIYSRIEALWPGARVYDHHGMTETGSVGYACSVRRGVTHIVEPSYIAEVIDPESCEPVAVGTTGELVLTSLGRLGSPLIRYRTGDLVKPEPRGPCACGSYELALDGGILGRLDDMVVIRGVNMYPLAVDKVIGGFDEVAEYRVEIREERGMSEMSLQVEPVSTCEQTQELADQVQRALKDAFNLNMPVSIVPTDHLPRFEMKAKRWIRV